MIRRLSWLWLLASCAPTFEPASNLSGLRVLAVQKDKPYAQPGETVSLKLLWHDATPERAARAPQIAWFALCENPASDLYALCFGQMAALVNGLLGEGNPSFPLELAARVSLPSAEATGLDEANDSFSFVVSPDIISSRPAPNGPGATPYGLTFVFFAVCAGTLGLDPSLDFPITCYEEEDGEPGFGPEDRRLGSDDFVVGYSAVFSYAELDNANPQMSGLEFGNSTLVNSQPLDTTSANSANVVLVTANDLCFGSDCPKPSVGANCPPELTVPSCESDCSERKVLPLIDPASAETDTVASALGKDVLQEQMWLNYYTTGGSFEAGDVKLLNDATTGWSDNHAALYRAPDESGVQYIWAVAHDNRGGSQWARVRICVE